MSTYGLICPNFGTSTVFGSTLSAIENTLHVGELNKLFTGKAEYCRECGKTCNVWTASKLEGIKKSSFEAYSYSEDQLEFNNVIIGDKNPYFYDGMMGLPDKVIILLKHPLAHTYSFLRREISEVDDHIIDEKTLLKSFDLYYKTLIERITWVNNNFDQKDVYWVYADAYFANFPDSLKVITKNIFSTDIYNLENITSNNHYFGGNHKVSHGGNSRLFFEGGFKADVRYQGILKDEHIRCILKHSENFKILRSLISNRTFQEIIFGEVLKSDLKEIFTYE